MDDNDKERYSAQIEELCNMRLHEMMTLFADALSAKLEEMSAEKSFVLNPIRPTDQAIAAAVIYLMRD